MVGLALVTAFSIVGASATASVDKLVGSAMRADYVISTAVGQPFTPEVAGRRLPGSPRGAPRRSRSTAPARG